MKPIIGILGSCSFFEAGSFFYGEKFYVNTSYIKAVIKNGGVPLPIAVNENYEDTFRLIDLCAGLLIPGGEDVDPAYYNENPHVKLGVIRPEMDRFIIRCLNYGFEKNIPIFGICRGHQIINIAKGGSLYQDMSMFPEETILHQQKYNRSYTVHKIEISKNTCLFDIFGENEIYVNTMHHQAVKELGDGLIASAFAPDGIIEALESEDGKILAVQWHPEELIESSPNMNKLFSYFINNMCL